MNLYAVFTVISTFSVTHPERIATRGIKNKIVKCFKSNRFYGWEKGMHIL